MSGLAKFLNFDWLSNMPMGWAKFVVLLAFIAPMIFALTMKKSYIYQGASNNAIWKNLKLWVLFVVGIQIAIYLYF